MKGKSLLVILAVMLLVPMVAFAQPGPSNSKGGYLDWATEAQSRNLPAGSVADPGSHLTYIVDTGVNARAMLGAGISDFDLAPAAIKAAAQKAPIEAGSLLQPILDADGNNALDPGAIYQSFISIVNTHPTQAVTVHFRYYNDNCEDVLDFLIVLTCNDTLIFDPFNFVIPFTAGENTRTRLIGPTVTGKFLRPISVAQWGSGRFVITAAASATTRNFDDAADILFPNEWAGFDEKCNIEATGTLADTVYTVAGLDAKVAGLNLGTGDKEGLRNVGTVAGFDANNLHVLNAFQITFNYLIGHVTTAVSGSFTGGDALLSYGVPAWARPTVDRTGDGNDNDFGVTGAPAPPPDRVAGYTRRNPFDGAPVGGNPNPDGDGPNDYVRTALSSTALDNVGILNYMIAWGSEPSINSALVVTTTGTTNHKYLRNEVHGGDIASLSFPGVRGADSWYGALATSALHPNVDADDQFIHFLSVADDYNGSNNVATSGQTFAILPDRSANISPAVTTYVLQIWDNDEHLFTFSTPPSVPVSPPQIQATSILKITCICLRVFRNFRNAGTQRDEYNGSTSVDDLSLADVALFGNIFATAGGGFRGLLNPLAPYADTLSRDESGGFIRFVRDNTVRFQVPNDVGATWEQYVPSGYGTTTFNQLGYQDNDEFATQQGFFGTSFLTIGQYVLRFEGFGVSWYLFTSASDPRVSAQGRELPQ